MSLKAKLEAVIYAAEEPVTLAQLAAMFADEALTHKAERAAALATAEPEAVQETLPLLDEGFASLGLEQAPALYMASQSEGGVLTHAEPGLPKAEVIAPEAPTDVDSQAVAEEVSDVEPASDPAANPEAEAKREARRRDREVRTVLEELIAELSAAYASDDRGIEIREIAGGYRMATKPECHDAVRGFIRSLKPPLKLSLQALETLAVVAYKQPVTAPEVSEIRGVESAGTLGSLLSRKLIATAGRKQVIGRPILYKTTREFLLRFGLKDVSELPSMEEFEKMAQVELDEEPPADEAEMGPENGEQPNGDNAEAGSEEGEADAPTAGASSTETTLAAEQAETEVVRHGE
jgi:segregation and condensation protein B